MEPKNKVPKTSNRAEILWIMYRADILWIMLCFAAAIIIYLLFTLINTPRWTEGYHHSYLVGDRAFEVEFLDDSTTSIISLGVDILITEDDIEILSRDHEHMRELESSILKKVRSIIREQAKRIRKDQFPNEYLNIVNNVREIVENRWPVKFSMKFIEISPLYDFVKEVKTLQDSL